MHSALFAGRAQERSIPFYIFDGGFQGVSGPSSPSELGQDFSKDILKDLTHITLSNETCKPEKENKLFIEVIVIPSKTAYHSQG